MYNITNQEVWYMWVFFALMSSVFAALTSIFVKIGIRDMDSNLATAIRTFVVLIVSLVIVFFTNSYLGIGEITKKEWWFLILSGIATGISWLCYYKAIQLTEVSRVVPIDKLSIVFTLIFAFLILGERLSVKGLFGACFIVLGAFLMIL